MEGEKGDVRRPDEETAAANTGGELTEKKVDTEIGITHEGTIDEKSSGDLAEESSVLALPQEAEIPAPESELLQEPAAAADAGSGEERTEKIDGGGDPKAESSEERSSGDLTGQSSEVPQGASIPVPEAAGILQEGGSAAASKEVEKQRSGGKATAAAALTKQPSKLWKRATAAAAAEKTRPAAAQVSRERKIAGGAAQVAPSSKPVLSKSVSLTRSQPQNPAKTSQAQAQQEPRNGASTVAAAKLVSAQPHKSLRPQASMKLPERSGDEARRGGAKSAAQNEDKEEKRKEAPPLGQARATKDQEKSEAKKAPTMTKIIRPKSANQAKKDADQEKRTEPRRLSLSSKAKAEEGAESKLKKFATFKASPLPSFYQKRRALLIKAEKVEKEDETEENKQQQKVPTPKASAPKTIPKPSLMSNDKKSDSFKIEPSESAIKVPAKESLKSRIFNRSKSMLITKPQLQQLDTSKKNEGSTKNRNAAEAIKRLFRGSHKALNAETKDGKGKLDMEGVSSMEGSKFPAVAVDA